MEKKRGNTGKKGTELRSEEITVEEFRDRYGEPEEEELRDSRFSSPSEVRKYLKALRRRSKPLIILYPNIWTSERQMERPSSGSNVRRRALVSSDL